MMVHTKEFWETVKGEYEPRNYYYAMCDTSKTFRMAWRQPVHKEEIRVLARAYLQELPYVQVEIPPESAPYLFHAMGWYRHDMVRKIFIDWCINKFSTDKK